MLNRKENFVHKGCGLPCGSSSYWWSYWSDLQETLSPCCERLSSRMIESSASLRMKSTKNIRQMLRNWRIAEDTKQPLSLFEDKQGTDQWPYWETASFLWCLRCRWDRFTTILNWIFRLVNMSKVLTSLTDTHVKEVVMLDIAVLSMAMSQAALYQNVQMSLTKTALDTAEQSAQQLVDMVQAPHPVSGHHIDLKG